MTVLIEVLQLSKSYGPDCELFRGATFRVQKGEFVHISGASGSGKSVLARMLLGVEGLNAGQILFKGHNIHRVGERACARIRRKMGIVFQDGRVVPTWTVFDNIAMPLIVAGRDRRFIRQRVLRVLEVLGLQHRADSPASGLGAAERRLVEIARGLIHSPLVFLGDEPLHQLASTERSRVRGLFHESSVSGTTFLLFSRDPPDQDGGIGQRWLKISNHRIEEVSSP